MPTYRVEVLARDGSTAKPLNIEAANPDAARAIASDQGWIVGKAEPIMPEMSSRDAAGSTPPSDEDFAKARYVADLRKNTVYRSARIVLNAGFWLLLLVLSVVALGMMLIAVRGGVQTDADVIAVVQVVLLWAVSLLVLRAIHQLAILGVDAADALLDIGSKTKR